MEIRNIPVADIVIDDVYQRPLDQRRVERMARQWSYERVQTLDISRRQPQNEDLPAFFAVIDGQHRLEAAKLVGVKELPCVVHSGLNQQQEAELWSKLNRERKPPSALEAFNAMLASEDGKALRILEIVERHGLRVGTKLGANANKVIVGVTALSRLYDYGEEILDDTLRIVAACWHGDKDSMLRTVLVGTGLMVKTYRGLKAWDVQGVIDKCQSAGVNELLKLAKSRERELNLSPTVAFAFSLVKHYNARKSSHRFPETAILADTEKERREALKAA